MEDGLKMSTNPRVMILSVFEMAPFRLESLYGLDIYIYNTLRLRMMKEMIDSVVEKDIYMTSITASNSMPAA
jgi:hypothetical protein